MDLIDGIIKDWQKERADIDCSGKEIIARMVYAHTKIVKALEKSLKSFHITPTIFSVLVTIRRRGKNGEVTIKQIMEEILITSGATSNLINKLVTNKLITKRPANKNEDARAVFVKLTQKGLELIDDAMVAVAKCENMLLQNFSPEEKSLLIKSLRTFISDE